MYDSEHVTTIPERSMSDSSLFTPVRLGALDLGNRIVLAPMTRSRAGAGNVPTELTARYYAQRASGGLLITEATQVVPLGAGGPNTPGIHTPAQVAAWRRVTDAVHRAGGRIVLQLWHAGRASHPGLQLDGAQPVAPSAIAVDGDTFVNGRRVAHVTPRALATSEIPEIVAQFRRGAELALDAGFDGVELHGANGYLLHQFLEDGSNRRTDAYGGSIENRARLLLEVTDAVVSVWGPERVGVRLSPKNGYQSMRDSDPAALYAHVAERLGERKIAYVHVVEPSEPLTSGGGLGSTSRFVRDRFGGAVVTNGGYDRESGEAVLASGAADLVAYGRLFLANPDLPRRFALGATLNAPDPATFYGGGAEGYIDYPALKSA
jgi:N-ethylmaleimide reductase